MTTSWSIREDLFTKKKEQEYLRRNRYNIVEKKQTLMAVALKNAGIFDAMDTNSYRHMFLEDNGGIF